MTLDANRFFPGAWRGRGVLMVCVLLALAERLGEAGGLAPRWASSHLDDLVCMPLVLGLILAVHRAAGRSGSWRLPFRHGLVVTGIFAVVFEVLLPHWQANATADPVDIAAYGLGLLVFHHLVNRPTLRVPAGIRRPAPSAEPRRAVLLGTHSHQPVQGDC